MRSGKKISPTEQSFRLTANCLLSMVGDIRCCALNACGKCSHSAVRTRIALCYPCPHCLMSLPVLFCNVSATDRQRNSAAIILFPMLCICTLLTTPVLKALFIQRLGTSCTSTQSGQFHRVFTTRAHSRLNTSMLSLHGSSMLRLRERSGEDNLRWFSQRYFFNRLYSSRDNSFCSDHL